MEGSCAGPILGTVLTFAHRDCENPWKCSVFITVRVTRVLGSSKTLKLLKFSSFLNVAYHIRNRHCVTLTIIIIMIYFCISLTLCQRRILLNELKFKLSLLVHSVLETRSVCHSPLWCDIYSVRQKTIRLVRNWEVGYCTYKSPSLDHMLSQMNPVHTCRISLSSKSNVFQLHPDHYVTYS